MKLNWNLLGGQGVQNKNLPWGEYGYFLELYNVDSMVMIQFKVLLVVNLNPLSPEINIHFLISVLKHFLWY